MRDKEPVSIPRDGDPLGRRLSRRRRVYVHCHDRGMARVRGQHPADAMRAGDGLLGGPWGWQRRAGCRDHIRRLEVRDRELDDRRFIGVRAGDRTLGALRQRLCARRARDGQSGDPRGDHRAAPSPSRAWRARAGGSALSETRAAGGSRAGARPLAGAVPHELRRPRLQLRGDDDSVDRARVEVGERIGCLADPDGEQSSMPATQSAET